MKKLFDSGELGRAESKNAAKVQWTTSVSFLAVKDDRSTPANANNSVLAKKTIKELSILMS